MPMQSRKKDFLTSGKYEITRINKKIVKKLTYLSNLFFFRVFSYFPLADTLVSFVLRTLP